MSRHPREYPVAERYDERETDFYRRPRREREYDDLEVDITRSRHPESRRPETIVKERDSVVSERRGPRQPDFLREDYGKSSSAGALVVREEEKREEDVYTRAPTRRRSVETVRSRAPPERVEKDTFVFEERERSDRGPPYPRDRGSEIGFRGRDDTEEKVIYRERTRSRPPPREEVDTEEKVIFRERTRSRPPPREEVDTEEKVIFRERTRSRPPPREREEKEEIDISIRREESRGPPPARSSPPVEEIRFRRGGGERPPPPRGTVEKTEIDITREESRGPPPRPRSVIEREEIDIRERRSPAPRPPRTEVDEKEFVFRESRRSPPGRGREVVKEEIDIDIRDRSAPPPRQRSMSRPNLVARKEEEWIIRRPRTPPPQDYEKEEIIIRRKERTPSPEPPPREPTPEPSPPPPPPLEPIYRPPIIQEVITHHRHIDHGVERARSPTPPPPSPPSPPPPVKETREDNLEIEIKRRGTRNGKAYEEDITIERDKKETEEPSREMERFEDRRRDVSIRRRSPSPRRRHDDEMAAEADYYNRKISSRAYPGEAYNGATRDWGLVDIPPGTERVRMDGVGGGAQEVYWERYSGQRRGRFISGDRAYEQEWGNGYSSPSPAPLPPPPAPHRDREEREEIKITHTRTNEEKPRKRDRMWTEVTKDLVIKEAIDEMGYEYEETDDHFYVIEYLKYEDVLRLVEISEDIKRERRERIREIQWEREERERVPKMLPPPPPVPAPPRSKYEERIYEREYIYDRDGRRRR